MSISRTLAPVLIALVLIATGASAFARPQDQVRRDREQRERSEQPDRSQRARARISLDQAVSMAERRFGARVVRAETRAGGDRIVYVLRLLNEAGRVWTVRVDAASGEFM